MAGTEKGTGDKLDPIEASLGQLAGIERYPSNAVLPEGASELAAGSKEAKSRTDSKMANSSQAESPAGVSVRSEQDLAPNMHDELERPMQDMFTQSGIVSKSLNDSSALAGATTESHSSPLTDKAAMSAAMSSCSSSTLTSSASSATAAGDSIMKPLQEASPSSTHNAMPSPSSFVQKRDGVNQVPKRQRIPRACDACR